MQLKQLILSSVGQVLEIASKPSLVYQSGSLPVLSGNLGNSFVGIDEGTEAVLVL